MSLAAMETRARTGAKFVQSLVITLKNVLQRSLPQGLIPVNRVDHNLRKFVPSARSKDKPWFTSISPERSQIDCQPAKPGKMQVSRSELPSSRR